MSQRRYALGIRYDGSKYHGWQSQHNLTTVQGSVEFALSKVANHPVTVKCAGRTDAGVHATGQVVHFDTEANRREYSWVFGANSNLPKDITVLWAKEVSMEFDARFSASERFYRYVLYNSEVRPGILREAISWHHRPLDVDLMQQAADHLIGEHDFTSFRGQNCQAKTVVRELKELRVYRQGQMIIIEARANAFLKNMVRNTVGLLMDVGAGSRPPIWAKEVLLAKDRSKSAMMAPPHGLYLVDVQYCDSFKLPHGPIGPFFLA